jgi:hypothetical protein
MVEYLGFNFGLRSDGNGLMGGVEESVILIFAGLLQLVSPLKPSD